MIAYELVGNDLDRRGLPKLASRVDKVMVRVAQNSAWQNFGDGLQNAAEGVANGVATAGQFANNWLTPQDLAAQSIEFLQQEFNSAVDQSVKQQVAEELQRRGIQPGATSGSASSTTNQDASAQSAEIAKVLSQARAAHTANGGGWTVINQAMASDSILTPASKQSLKQQFAQFGETNYPQSH